MFDLESTQWQVVHGSGPEQLQADRERSSISLRLRRHGVDEAVTKLDTVLCFVLLCSSWDGLNVKLLAARDRCNFMLIVQ